MRVRSGSESRDPCRNEKNVQNTLRSRSNFNVLHLSFLYYIHSTTTVNPNTHQCRCSPGDLLVRWTFDFDLPRVSRLFSFVRPLRTEFNLLPRLRVFIRFSIRCVGFSLVDEGETPKVLGQGWSATGVKGRSLGRDRVRLLVRDGPGGVYVGSTDSTEVPQHKVF